MIIAMFIIVFIAVPLRRILRGQDNNREAGGTDLPNLHTGQDGDDGVALLALHDIAGNSEEVLIFLLRISLASPSVAPTGKPGSSINSRARELAVIRWSSNVTVSIVLSIVRIIV